MTTTWQSKATDSFGESGLTLVIALKKWLGSDGVAFFSEMLAEHGRIDAVFSVPYGDPKEGPQKSFPHSVHFREGMQVRNFLRSLPETQGWTTHQYDANWALLVGLALDASS